MQFRTAKNNDSQSVLAIIKRSRAAYLPYAKSPHTAEQDQFWVSSILIPTGTVVIAKLKGEDVGVLATSIENNISWIDQLYIAPGYLGQGIGYQLLKIALDKLPRPIHLWTFQENQRARRFYEYHGFKAIKQTDGANNEEKCPDVLYELNHTNSA